MRLLNLNKQMPGVDRLRVVVVARESVQVQIRYQQDQMTVPMSDDVAGKWMWLLRWHSQLFRFGMEFVARCCITNVG